MTRYRIKPKSRIYSLRKDWRTFWPVLAIFAVPLLLALLVLVKISWTQHPKKLPAGQDLHLNISKLRTNRLHLFETSVSERRRSLSWNERGTGPFTWRLQLAHSATAVGARIVCRTGPALNHTIRARRRCIADKWLSSSLVSSQQFYTDRHK